jgi:hemolysin activation/secretion protein
LIEKAEARYKVAGYFLAQAYLPPQKIKDGAVEIAITEGRLGETRIEGESNISPDVVFAYLDKLPKGRALTLLPLERQVLLINDLAGSKASLDMQAGAEPGTTDLVIVQKVDAAFGGRLDVSNHGSPSTGEKRIGLSFTANSPLHRGERITGSLMTTDTVNLRSYNIGYDHPLGGDGWRAAVTVSRAEYDLGGAFKSLQGSGTADSLRLGLSYPLIRSRAANLRLQVELERSKLNDQLKATGSDVNKGSRGLVLSTAFDALDEFGGGGTSRAELKIKTGRIALGTGATAPETEGYFSKTSVSLARQQTLGKTLSASLQLSYQLAGKNLDSSEKFSAGGPASMPGYANGTGSADSGNLVRFNLRWQPHADLALGFFFNQSHLRLNVTPAATLTTSNYKILKDHGLSADWSIGKGVSANAVLAWADVIDESTPVTAGADYFRPRLWFNLSWGW